MTERSHLRITRRPDVRRYKYAKGGGFGEFKTPPRDRLLHASKLTTELLRASDLAQKTRQEQGLLGRPKAIVYTFKSDPDSPLKIESLERIQSGIEIQNVHMDGKVQVAAIRVPEGQLNVFFKLVKDYQSKAGKKPGTFKNQKLIESITSIGLTTLKELWADPTAPIPPAGQPVWWEIWLRVGSGGARPSHARVKQLLVDAGMRISDQFISFIERVVTLGFGTQEQLSSSLDVLAEIAELRQAKEVASEYLSLSLRSQREYVVDAERRVVPPPLDAPAVCLLDTGVNRGHALIEPALDEGDAQALRAGWGTADSDHQQHGTGMAGIALYGCLTNLFESRGPYPLAHRLESVKLLPPRGANDPELYGALTQEAVALAEIQAPQRNRAICMAVTRDHDDKALPSSWSAAIDQMCSGQLDQTRRLMFISAGNIRDIASADYQYHHTNCTSAGLEDPGQAWNAVTVGAITEKVVIRKPEDVGWMPLASSPGELCPTSRTSLAWDDRHHVGWPLKPDIVMEGGNYAQKGGDRSTLDDLCLLTTAVKIDGGRLTTTCDTSPATAAAARLGAIIWQHYPRLRPETVRGLLVHSARWTDAMRARFPGDLKATVQKCLRCYGYGVPRPSKVLWSNEQAATLIYEGELQPYNMIDGDVKTFEMHLHRLPWPREVLLELGATSVTMRVTLSYFIEPSPGRVGWLKQHRYQSHGLRFDVNRPTEDEAQFRQRLSRAEWDDPDERPKSVKETREWVIGSDGRTHGSIHSDWWEGTAADLANSDRLAVYPVTGWWLERSQLERWTNRARYSLIVSLETPATGVDLYAAMTENLIDGGDIEIEV